MLPIIQSLWIGAPLSNLEKLCVQSFLDHGHKFHLYTYADIDGVPEGAVIKDGNEILPYSELTGGVTQEPGVLSDYFRYALLNKKGGWWVDMDTVCLRQFDFPEEIVFCKWASGRYTFPNSPLRFPAGHPLMITLQKVIQKNLHRKGLVRTKVGGPPIFTEQVYKANLQHLAVPSMRFFLPHENEAAYFNDSYRDGLHFPANAHALHVYNSVLVRRGVDKNAQFDAESLFEQLKARHHIPQAPGARRVTSAEVDAWQQARTNRERKATHRREKREKALWIAVAVLALALVVLCLL